LIDLTVRLATGVMGLPDELRERHAAWLLSQQQPDGGFGGREGGSDLYYTSFGLRSLMLLGALDGEPAARACGYLGRQLQTRQGVIDLVSLVFAAQALEAASGLNALRSAYAGWQTALTGLLESLRREEGGYAKTPHGTTSSTYQTFLTLLCYELIERQPPGPASIAEFLRSQEHPLGGFLEVRLAKRAGVNPTAAAVGGLRMLDAIDDDLAVRTAAFLSEQQSDDGGLTANTRIPVADLLSTCTGLIASDDLRQSRSLDRAAAARYARSMERPDGGFAGFALDPSQDVEYTFYGLAALALTEVLDGQSGAMPADDQRATS
jgi:geranylgeranyl transferase type-2 subunit beta